MTNLKLGQQAGRFLATLLAVTMSLHSAQAQCNCGGSSGGSQMFALPMSGDIVPGSFQIIEEDAIYLTINVPEDTAPLKVNNDPTISIGATRYFVIRHLEPGKSYEFEVVAERANAAGVAMEEIRVFRLTAGSSKALTMNPIKRKGDPDAKIVEYKTEPLQTKAEE
ncbi:MAG: hypothetical protein KDB03_15990 [Planctomycetales bacterium]|nr:hypothetical protein [Planctomycetales bacterium]